MQRKILYIGILIMAAIAPLKSQETARQRIEQQRRQESSAQQPRSATSVRRGNTDGLMYDQASRGSATTSVRQRHIDESIENAKWSRIIYRSLDLTNESNAPLYYTSTTSNAHSSLFSMLFRLLQNDAIPVYEYLDGHERFTDEYRMEFQDFLERFDIYYEETDGTIVVHDADIPDNEVLGYFVKEAYYFDTPTSRFVVRPLALCPVLHRRDDYATEATRYPLFWIPYLELQPYVRQMPAMASSLNNSMNGTVDDFFRLRKYDGEIYKAQNPRNLTISQYTSTPEEMKAEQDRIEQELIDFQHSLSNQQEEFVPSEQPTTRRDRRRPSRASSGTSSVTMRDRRY